MEGGLGVSCADSLIFGRQERSEHHEPCDPSPFTGLRGA